NNSHCGRRAVWREAAMKARRYCVGTTLWLVSAISAAATPSFTSIELHSPAGSPGNVSAEGINRRGDVIGSSGGQPFVYYHRNGSVLQLGGLAPTLSAFGINDRDQVVGMQVNPTGIHPVEWTANGGAAVLPLSDLGYATAIGDNGDIAGNMDNGHADNIA